MTTDNRTYLSANVNFINAPQQRSATNPAKDARMLNCFAETVKGEKDSKKTFINMRAGLQGSGFTTVNGVSRGIYYFNGSLWSVKDNKLFRDSTQVQILSTSTGTVGFIEYAGSVTYPRNLIVLDGVSGWVIDLANVITPIVDPDFPTPHVTRGVYMDGYLFVVKAGTADIYNSDLDNPTAWTAGSFITAEMFPDTITALIRQSNYILAMGSNTIEYFYDAANSPGTPLARNSAAQHQWGVTGLDACLIAEEQVVLIGQTQLGGRSIWILDGFKPIEISTEEVRVSLDAEGTNITTAKLFCARSMGHRFLVIQLTNRTWVFDFEEKMWHEWRDYSLVNKFPCDYVTDHPSGSIFMTDRTTGQIYKFVDNLAADFISGVPQNITIQMTSTKMDFGTMDRKFGNRFSIMCDVPAGGGGNFQLEWSDDDYQTWTTPRNILISSTMPQTTQLGQFRRRAFRLTYNVGFPIRIEQAKFDINMGNR